VGHDRNNDQQAAKAACGVPTIKTPKKYISKSLEVLF
jgi:hypothetical protein